MPFVLRHLVIDRVDLVDKGANPKAHILVVKRNVTNSSKREEPSMTAISKRASAWAEWKQIAHAFMDKDPSLTEPQAIDKAMRTPRGFEILKDYRDGVAAGEDPEWSAPEPLDTGENDDEKAAWSKILAKADAMVDADASGTLTREKACDRVMQRFPELTKAYRDAGRRRA